MACQPQLSGLEISLFDAARAWKEGCDLRSASTWLPWLWWGRIGKIAQFFGALAVIIELAGPKRLEKMSTSIRAVSFSPAATAALHLQDLKDGAFLRRARWHVAALAFSILTVIYIGGRLPYESWWYRLAVVPVLSVGSLVVLPVLLGLLHVIMAALGQLLSRGLLSPAAGLMSRPRLSAESKTAGLLLVVAGFSLDLMAS